jgi:hypothetical protein
MRFRSFVLTVWILCVAGLGFSAAAQRGRNAPSGPAKATPLWPDGHVNLGALPGESGLWTGNGGRLVINPNSYEADSNRTAPIHIDDAPFQPWTKALTNFRHRNVLADEPHTRCKPSPGPRQFVTPYGTEILEVPELQRLYIFDVGGPHSYRVVYMDGRPHPAATDLVPSYYGHSIGRWEGATLVIDSVGFNERAWMNRDGIPHTDRLHLIERLSRPDSNTLRYDVTIDDPGAFTKPWDSGFSLNWSAGTEMFEYICQDNNHAPEMMVGTEGLLRRARIAP